MNQLVSAIMPVRGRRGLALKAVQCFLSQTYKPKELLIIQDRDDLTFNVVDKHEFPKNIYVMETRERLSIGAKRNILCRLSESEHIAHFDSDDYSAPERLEHQIELLRESGKAVCGFKSMYFVDEHGDAALYKGRFGSALGTSLVYRRDWWKAHPFPEHTRQNIEDVPFMNEADKAQQLILSERYDLMVARIHKDNTSPKNINDYTKVDISELPKGFHVLA